MESRSSTTIAINLRPLYPGLIGGMETYVRLLLDRWIGSPLGNGISWVLFTNEANHHTLDHLATGCKRILLPNGDYESFLFSQLVQLKPDVYFCPLLTLEPLDPPCLSAITIPDMQHAFFPEFFPEDILRWRHVTFPASAHRAACVFTISEYSKKTIVDKLGVASEKVVSIHLNVDELFRDVPTEEAIDATKRRYGLPDDYFYFPANFWPHKNHETLYRAFASAVDGLRSGSLVLTGAQDPRFRILEELARELGIGSRVHYAGYVPKRDLPCFYRGARALVFPSLFEGFGIPIAEAFCCDCPVICSNTTSCPEIAGDAAILVDPRDVAGLADAMQTVYQDDAIRKRLIKSGRGLAEKILANRLAENTLERLHTVIAEGKAVVAKSVKHATRGSSDPTVTRSWPKITIVTPSLNQGRFIEQTIQSVLGQKYENLEYLVMDGGSTDDTLRILKRYEGRLQWWSEKDRGQAHAINKGFGKATGEILGYLNSDDLYEPGALAKVARYFADHPEVDMVYGEGFLMTEDGRKRRFPATEPDFNLQRLICIWDYILQQSTFIRRNLLDRIGYMDESLHFGLDWELWIRAGKAARVGYLAEYLGTLREYDSAKSFSGGFRRIKELYRIVHKYTGKWWPAPSFFIYSSDWLESKLYRFLRFGLRGRLARAAEPCHRLLTGLRGRYIARVVNRASVGDRSEM